MVDQKRILLSDSFWKFRFIRENEQISEEDYINGLPNDQNTLKVYVPTSWSYYQNRKNFYHFGQGIYETSMYLPYAWGTGDGKKVTLVFNGSNYKTTLWINGKKVGFHEGGYTKFWFEINDYVTFGTTNRLIVLVDNRYMENRIPWFKSPEWMNYGGIYRPVYLKLTSQVCFDDYKVTNVFHYQDEIGHGSTNLKVDVNIRILLKDSRPVVQDFLGSIIAILKNTALEESIEVPVRLSGKLEKFANLTITIPNPHLWSPDDPNLYTLSIQLIDKKNRKELDRESIQWGIREIKAIGKDLYLNNRKITLRGISRHEDHPDVGSSMNPRLIYNDLNIIKEAHINCIRTSHYPPHESLLDFADEMGFLVLEEVPIYRLEKEQYTSEYRINAQQQLWEMIHRDKNHCSVIAWIVSSECDVSSPEGVSFMSTLISLSKELDPFRLHTLVTDTPLTNKTLDIVDLICVNLYTGWYDRYDVLPETVEQKFDEIQKYITENTSTKPLILSEFGAGAIAGFKSFANAHWSENYQYDLLRTYLDLIIKKGYFAGSIVWHFQDFRCSPFKGFQERPKEYNNKGIVDMHRNPKISFYIVQNRYQRWKELIDKSCE